MTIPYRVHDSDISRELQGVKSFLAEQLTGEHLFLSWPVAPVVLWFYLYLVIIILFYLSLQ
jgi:hypothetical protein